MMEPIEIFWELKADGFCAGSLSEWIEQDGLLDGLHESANPPGFPRLDMKVRCNK
jgi:hypothetical protein